ncbi:MAG: prephenate dehydratase domain-containing protein [Nanoarchaeota archaeon]|nr:prephenate dehydratase domain-containing protein [Nanoarchaeota archaeon]
MKNENLKNKTIAYLGPKGSYSEKAAKMVANAEGKLLPLEPVDEVVESLVARKSDLCVLPHYNSIAGYVQQHLDLIYNHRLTILGVKRVSIELCIGNYPGNSGKDDVYSHPKALQQCSKYLRENLPKARTIETSSTSEAAEIVRNKKSGLAICSIDALVSAPKLEIIAKDIGNIPGTQNYTDFYVVCKETDAKAYENYAGNSVDKNKCLTMVAITPHVDEIGLLSDILSQIRYHNLNMTDIHSRPAIDKVNIENNNEPKMFYIEIEGHKSSENFVRAMDAISWKLSPEGKQLEIVRIMGSYENI